MVLRRKKALEIIYTSSLWALGVSAFFIVFERPLRPLVYSLLVKSLSIESEALFKLMLYVFLSCSFALVAIIYWLAWQNKNMRSKITRYISKMVCPDYYRENRRLDYDAFMGDAMGRFSDKDKLTEEDFKHDGSRDSDRVYNMQNASDLETSVKEGDHVVKRVFYPNGNLKQETHYKNGKLDGTFRVYYEEGALHQEKVFRDGQLNGVSRAYDEDGVPFFSIEYQDDKQHGKDVSYHKNGLVQYEDTYVMGARINRKTFDAQGVLKFSQDFQ